jgi:hypothetical protein
VGNLKEKPREILGLTKEVRLRFDLETGQVSSSKKLFEYRTSREGA